MCGRFSQAFTWEEVFQFSQPLTDARSAGSGNMQPHYNIAPTDTVQIIRRSAAGGRELVLARWGLIPTWWDKPIKEFKLATFNARVEEVETKASFRVRSSAGAASYRRLVSSSGPAQRKIARHIIFRLRMARSWHLPAYGMCGRTKMGKTSFPAP